MKGRGVIFLPLSLLLASLSGVAAASDLPPKLATPLVLQVRRGDSTVAFTIKKWGVMREQGRFREFAGSIVYDPSRPTASRVSLSVDVRSIDTGVGGRDRALLSADFFDAARHPRWTFVSTGVAPLSKERTARQSALHRSRSEAPRNPRILRFAQDDASQPVILRREAPKNPEIRRFAQSLP